MDENEIYRSRRKKAGLAGIAYLILAFAALPDMVRKTLFVMNDPVATSKNILSDLAILKLSILGDIATEISFLFLALCLYSLLGEVRRSAARAMLSMVVIAVAMTIFNTGVETAAIDLFTAGDQVHGMILLGVFKALGIPAAVFYGLWMLPLGYLFFKSGFMPKTLGIGVMIGSSGYVIHAACRIVSPGVSEHFLLLSVAGEIAIIAWLLAFGVKKRG